MLQTFNCVRVGDAASTKLSAHFQYVMSELADRIIGTVYLYTGGSVWL